jgi:hypothetical protein
MKTLRLIQYSARLRKAMFWAFIGIAAVSIVIGFLLPGRPIWSALIGVLGSAVVLGMSAFSIAKMVDSDDLGVGWLAVDYVVKIAAIAGVTLVPKFLGGFNLGLIAGIVIISVVVTMAIQVYTLQVRRSEG